MKLSELLIDDVLSPDLFVTLPAQYFSSWNNFPLIPTKWNSESYEDIELASYHSIIVRPGKGKKESIDDYHHPYDQELKDTFIKRFATSVPNKIEGFKHQNGSTYYPYEAYFAYWRGYILFEALEECFNIEKFLPREKGVEKFKESVAFFNEKWNLQYQKTFNRLSFYKTFSSRNVFAKNKIENIEAYLLEYTNSTLDELESDMENLLTLFQDWKWKIEKYDKCNYTKLLELLRQDIFLLLQWLTKLSGSVTTYFDRWSNNGPVVSRWAELKEVVNYEEFDFEKTFKFYLP